MRLEPARADHAPALADLHRASFDTPWSLADIVTLLGGPGGYGVIGRDQAGEARGFVLARAIAGEAEILTLAVDPAHRRQGLARALVEAAAVLAAAHDAQSLFLEVAADNAAAIGLYRRADFAEVGRRRGYYPRAGASAVDALVMRRDLNSAPA